MKNYTLSIAIIVKNEEKVIARCLESVKGLADEIIIVDTGSNDATASIAGTYGALVYDWQWDNDFAAARNYSFSKCTKDWILWLDADDIIQNRERDKIGRLDLAGTTRDQILLLYDYAQDAQGNPLRLFYRERILRRVSNPKWVGKIHECITLQNYASEPIVITHKRIHGSQAERNLKILRSAVDSEKDKSLLARYLFYLGKEYFDVRDWEQYRGKGYEQRAITALERLVTKFEVWNIQKAKACIMLAYMLYDSDKDRYRSYLLTAIMEQPDRAEAYYLMGIYFSDKQQWESAIPWYKMCLEVKMPDPILDHYDSSYYTWIPCMQLCFCYNGLGDMKTAYAWNERGLLNTKDARLLSNRTVLGESLKMTPQEASDIVSVQPRKQRHKGGIFTIVHDGKGKKLNLGCGKKTMEGYENADNFEASYIDAVYDLFDIPYQDGTISAINSEHALEHVGKENGLKAIKEWARVLKRGGTLDLKIPDLIQSFQAYQESIGTTKQVNNMPAAEWYKHTIFGWQKSLAGETDASQYHTWGYSKLEIQGLLEQSGFVIQSLEEYDGFGTPSMQIVATKGRALPRVVWIAPENWEAAQTRIRVLHVNKWLQEKGYDSKVMAWKDIVIGSVEILIVGKNFDETELASIRNTRKLGLKVYCDLCEDILTFPYVIPIIRECDKVICCSTLLEEKVRQYNSNTIVIEDAHE